MAVRFNGNDIRTNILSSLKTTTVTLDTLTIPSGLSMGSNKVLVDSDYTPISVVGVDVKGAVLNQFKLSDSKVEVAATNIETESLTVTPEVTILWVKNNSI